jgi:ParB family transcriptional regulator, chromosome partitioning protein
MDKPKRGLGSLIPTGEWELPTDAMIPESPNQVEISQIRSNPYQPRLSLKEDQLQELAESIRQHGVIQPLLVRRMETGYELIAGERRLEAAKAAGLTQVPVIFRDCNEQQMLELALVENIQREDMNPIDRAKAYDRLRNDFGMDQEAISAAVGKSRASVANSMRLLSLPDQVQNVVAEGKLSEGHGRALISLDSPREIVLAAEQVVKRGLSVRATELMVKRISQRLVAPQPAVPKTQDPNLADLESRISISLGTKARITPPRNENSKGYILIEFYGNEDLDRISSQLLGEQS